MINVSTEKLTTVPDTAIVFILFFSLEVCFFINHITLDQFEISFFTCAFIKNYYIFFIYVTPVFLLFIFTV